MCRMYCFRFGAVSEFRDMRAPDDAADLESLEEPLQTPSRARRFRVQLWKKDAERISFLCAQTAGYKIGVHFWGRKTRLLKIVPIFCQEIFG